MKVLYIAGLHSPFDHNAGSGKDYDLYQGLVRNGADVVVSGPFPFSQTLPERISRKAHTILLKGRPAKYPRSFLAAAARQVMVDIRQHDPQVIFSKYAGILFRLKTDRPIVHLCDTTLQGSQREWPIFSRLAFDQQNRYEQSTYDMSTSIIVHSQWSAEDLVQLYHQPSGKIHVFAHPASLPASVIPESIPPKDLHPLKILLVGREFRRKGTDIALEVVRQLKADGIDTLLKVAGLDGASDDLVQYMGLYNKTIPGQLEGYAANYAWANFLIHPARFEAAGIVPSEAAAFGVPTITNNSGGLGTTVADGVSGVVLPKDSPAQAYVNVIRRYLDDPAAYHRLCQTTRIRYCAELNWEVAAARLYKILQAASGVD